jgi:hypothetical protein
MDATDAIFQKRLQAHESPPFGSTLQSADSIRASAPHTSPWLAAATRGSRRQPALPALTFGHKTSYSVGNLYEVRPLKFDTP